MCDENNKELKIGLLAPFSGVYKNLGDSLLLSTQLALNELDNKKITIIPRDSGSNNKEKLNAAIQEIIDSGAKVIIGPVDSDNFEEIKKYKDTIFISLSNKNSKIKENIISIGISLESQLDALENFIIKQEKKKTVIMYPKNEYTQFIDERIKSVKLKNYKIFKYNPDPKVLTGEIEKLTNYTQRKKNLNARVKILEKKDDEISKRELLRLEQKYTLGKVNFDSVIIIDFGNSLKSVLASLVFADVDEKDVLSIGFDNLEAKVVKVDLRKITCKVLEGGSLENNKGVHVVNRNIKLNYITEKDKQAIDIAKKMNVRHFALSFTNSHKDMFKFNKLLKKQVKIYKIESRASITNLDKIISTGQKFIIDRGDLSKAVSVEIIPIIQRKILRLARIKKKKVYVATNFLESMIKNKYPTRGEANDIYNTLELGAAGLVLASETAVGNYPRECVMFLRKMINIFEKYK